MRERNVPPVAFRSPRVRGGTSLGASRRVATIGNGRPVARGEGGRRKGTPYGTRSAVLADNAKRKSNPQPGRGV